MYIIQCTWNPSVKSLKLKSMSNTEEAISTPTMISAGTVSALGIMAASGAIRSASKKKIPVVTTMTSESFNPIMVIKRPIPTVMARFKELGTVTTRICRIFVTVRMMKIIPEINTVPRATLHGIPTPANATVAKSAFNHIPGANAIGKLATKPMAIVTKPAESAVAKNTAFLSIPVDARILELRNRIYAIVIKVVDTCNNLSFN